MDITRGGIAAFVTDALLDNKQDEEFRVYDLQTDGGVTTNHEDPLSDDCSDSAHANK